VTHDVSADLYRERSIKDALTGLANRAALTDYVDGGPATGVAYLLDVDGFKLVNDSLGHPAGDRLLSLLADRLRAHARAQDLLARTGGDEFVLIARVIATEEDALALAERLTGVCAEPFDLDGFDASVSITIGAALLNSGDDTQEALRNADLALYTATSARRGSVRLFEPQMRDRVLDRIWTEHHLRNALERGELRLVYQPVVDVNTGALSGMEALLRWNSSELGPIAPDKFIPVAEHTGLILPIGRFVFAEAIAQLARWTDAGHDLTLAVNMSANQLADDGLPDLIADLCARHGVAPQRLCVELTESTLGSDALDRPAMMLDRLREAGVALALDDFGTGYSSLERMSRLQLDVVKIDRSFISRMLYDQTAAAVVDAVVRIAEALAVTVTAEGIETVEQLQRVRELGCHHAQGFLFAKPLEAADADALLAERAPSLAHAH
jgi:diguanylate cyclase (GGDEF)-like protein